VHREELASFVISECAWGNPASPVEPGRVEKFEYCLSNILMLAVPSVVVLPLVIIQLIYYLSPYSVLSDFSTDYDLVLPQSNSNILCSLKSSSSCLRFLLRFLVLSVLFCLTCKF
jgi:hypothetical protein